MSEDATLDEFLETASEAPAGDETPTDEAVEDGGPSEGNEGNGVESGRAEADDDRSEVGAVGPFDATVRWTPDGAACASCGTTVERRWTDGTGSGSAFICADCKEW